MYGGGRSEICLLQNSRVEQNWISGWVSALPEPPRGKVTLFPSLFYILSAPLLPGLCCDFSLAQPLGSPPSGMPSCLLSSHFCRSVVSCFCPSSDCLCTSINLIFAPLCVTSEECVQRIIYPAPLWMTLMFRWTPIQYPGFPVFWPSELQ